MSLSTFLSSLKPGLSSGAEVLMDSSDGTFKTVLERWSNEGVEVPGAILRPATELDAITIVSKMP
jgi:hypothetical protein